MGILRRLFRRDRQQAPLGQTGRSRIERDTLRALGAEATWTTVISAQDGPGLDWGLITFTYGGLEIELARDRGTIDGKVGLQGGEAFDFYAVKAEVEQERGAPRALSLEAACRWLISRSDAAERLLSSPSGPAQVEAADERNRAAILSDLEL